MSSYQPPGDQGSSWAVPTVEVTDYDYIDPDLEDCVYADTSADFQTYQASPSSKKLSGKHRARETTHSGSDTERDRPEMSSRSSRHASSSSKRHSGSSKSKTKRKSDDWTDITDPEERRRIQNRIAQRKFREKAREQREQAQRDAQNHEHAVNAYRIPEPDDFLGPGQEEDVSGLPWGSFSMGYIVARGHESASQQGSRRTSDQQQQMSPPAAAAAAAATVTADMAQQQEQQQLLQQQQQHYMNPYSDEYGQQVGVTSSYDGMDSSGDDVAGGTVYEESPYFYDYENASPGDGYGPVG